MASSPLPPSSSIPPPPVEMHVGVASPFDADSFSTPPTSPSALATLPPILDPQHQPRPTISRRASRPQMIHIDKPQQATHPFQLDSPDTTSNQPNSSGPARPLLARTAGDAKGIASAVPAHIASLRQGTSALPKSPCFVHSLLDKGISLTDWLRDTNGGDTGHYVKPIEAKEVHQPSVPSVMSSPSPSNASTNSLGWIPSPTDYDEEEDGAASLTRQLAATAVGVREMSKQLGRARVKSNIQNVMIITKARDNRLIKLTRDVAMYLMGKPTHNGRGLVVYVDHQLRTSKRFDAAAIEAERPDFFRPQPRRYSSTSDISGMSEGSGTTNGTDTPRDEGQLRYWTSDMCSKSPHLFDFVVTLGGDGTVLFTSWLFQKIVPPVLPFALGSLGFLTNFDFADHVKVMDSVMEKGIRVNLRMRFTCTVYRAVKPEDERHGKRRRAVKKGDTGEIMMKNIEQGGWEALEGNNNAAPHLKCKDKEIMCFTTRPVETFEVLNDLVVDRGPSPYVSLLELFGDEHHMTTVQADGLTISTPTGSTAYSLSAGGSLVHPEIPTILITPICPHTLSFRPMLLPDSMELRVCVPYNSRSTAWASFDGRGRVELKQGDHIKITASKFPFPTVCADNQSVDWFNAISRTLKWNERERQKSFVVVEEGPEQPKKKRSRNRGTDATPNAADRVKMSDAAAIAAATPVVLNRENDDDDDGEDEEDEEEEEEEKFDIDDSSPEAAAAAANNTTTNTTTSSSRSSIVDILRDASSQSSPSSSEDVELEGRPTSYAAQRAAAIIAGDKMMQKHSASGIETPSRFSAPIPHPSKVHSRHIVGDGQQPQPNPSRVQHQNLTSPPDSATSMRTPRPHDRPQALTFTGAVPNSAGLVGHAKKVEKQHHLSHRRGRSVGDPSGMTRRTAFAVYGQDESDSNASE